MIAAQAVFKIKAVFSEFYGTVEDNTFWEM